MTALSISAIVWSVTLALSSMAAAAIVKWHVATGQELRIELTRSDP